MVQEMTEQYLNWLKGLIAKNDLSPFYLSKEFRKISKEVLKEQKECQICKANHRHGPAEIAHHLFYVKKYPELALSIYTPSGERNIIAVCQSCHNKIHFGGKKRYTNVERW